MDTQDIFVITTGGTIDKEYFDALDDYQFGRSKIDGILKTARVNLPFEIAELKPKDSLELNDDDRSNIVAAVRAAGARRIVITHWTDTMAVTAERLAAQGFEKTIVLTGAFLPARFAESDASFNLGMAFATAQTAPHGVYIAMNGTVFPAGAVFKDRERGTFRAWGWTGG